MYNEYVFSCRDCGKLFKHRGEKTSAPGWQLILSGLSMVILMGAEPGVSAESLTWSGFFTRNLLPVTIGNIIGGVFIGLLMWVCYLQTFSSGGFKTQKI